MAKDIQTVLFDVNKWTVEQARSWLGDHDMKHDKVDTTEKKHRFRQFDPGMCMMGSHVTLTENFPDGIEAVACDKMKEAPSPLRKAYQAEMKTLRNGDVEAYVSTETVDRMGDVIRAKGWELGNFIKSGSPVLFAHDYGSLPIGNAVEMQIQRKGLWSVTRFHEKTQMSRDAALLAREKIMPSWSVGFNPIESEPRTSEDGKMLGFTYNKQELLEYSLVAVPANPDAVSKAIHLAQEGLISRALGSIFAGPSPQAEEDGGMDGAPARQAAHYFGMRENAFHFTTRTHS